MPAIPHFTGTQKIVWIGDSITRGGGFHSVVRLFHETRYPNRALRWVNCGLSGDEASGALRRLDWDIAPHRPDVAVIMFGMNDCRREQYDPQNTIDLPARHAAITNCLAHLATLSEQLTQLDARCILVCPTPYDQTGTQAETNRRGVDDALRAIGDGVRELATARGLPWIDFHAPLIALQQRFQAEDPAFSVIGPDRVHPGPPGHLVLAQQVLVAQGHDPVAWQVSLQADTNTSDRCRQATVDGLSLSATGGSFSLTAEALPFPQPDDLGAAAAWAPDLRDLSRESLAIRGLQTGTYAVLIDDQPCGSWSAATLADGIELGQIASTPQASQARLVAEIHRKRHHLESDIARTLVAVEHFHLRPAGIARTDHAAARAFATSERERFLRTGFAYGAWQLETFLAWDGRSAELQAAIADHDRALHAASRPITHRYVVRRSAP